MFIIQSLVSLPSELQLAIVAIVGFGVAFVLNYVSLNWPWLGEYLGQYKDQVVSVVSAAVIAYISSQLGLIPLQFETLANALLQVFVALAVLGLPFLTFQFLRNRVADSGEPRHMNFQ